MSVVVLDEYAQDSVEMEVGEQYSLVQLLPTVLVDGILVNYLVVNRSNGAYEYVAGMLPEARGVFEALENGHVAVVGDTFPGSEVCH